MVDFNADFFDFREDDSYKFTRWTLLGGTYYRGKYQMRDSLIIFLDSEKILLNDDVKLVLKTDQFVIKQDSTSRYLYQIDGNDTQLRDTDIYRILKYKH